jgi:hypothetical protein
MKTFLLVLGINIPSVLCTSAAVVFGVMYPDGWAWVCFLTAAVIMHNKSLSAE